MKISVVIPVYNKEKYINDLFQCLLSQTFEEFECILIDDGSTDASGDICDKVACIDKRFEVIHIPNSGVSHARNVGIDASCGEYITFIDSDDVVHPCYLECLLKAGKHADISMGKLERFSGETVSFADIDKNEKPDLKTGQETLGCFFEQKAEVANYVSACCKLYKRELFDGIVFPEGRLFEDEFTTYRLYYKADKVAVSQNILYYYYVNDTGITRNLTLLKRCDEYDAQWERIYFFYDHQLTDLWKLALREYLATALWDLKDSNKAEAHPKIEAFQQQYRSVLKMAKKAGAVHFKKDYDYFVLAYPKRVFFYRVLRQILNICK